MASSYLLKRFGCTGQGWTFIQPKLKIKVGAKLRKSVTLERSVFVEVMRQAILSIVPPQPKPTSQLMQ